MTQNDVYIYGMTVLSTIHLLKGKFPVPDAYQEIQETFVMPGGEAANCAIVLSNLGVRVSLDGCYLGDQTEKSLLQYFSDWNVDCSKMIREAGFDGWRGRSGGRPGGAAVRASSRTGEGARAPARGRLAAHPRSGRQERGRVRLNSGSGECGSAYLDAGGLGDILDRS